VHLGLQSLDLDANNSLEFPPRQIAESGCDAILAFFTDLRKGSVTVCHGNIMMVGPGMAGKSTLAKALNMNDESLRNLLQELKDKAGMV